MQPEIVTKIQSRGHWRINFQPLVAEKKIDPLSECREIVEKNAIRLRGWDYPYFPQDGKNIEPCDTYYHAWCDWWSMKEYWRMYQSGQFLHYLGLREDWVEEDQWSRDLVKQMPPGSALHTTNAIYQFTEVFEFLSRLALKGIYDEGVKIQITLNKTAGRALRNDDPMRVPFHVLHKTGGEKVTVFDEKLTKDDIVTHPKDLAVKAVLVLFEKFAWKTSEDSIRKDQEDFLTGKR